MTKDGKVLKVGDWVKCNDEQPHRVTRVRSLDHGHGVWFDSETPEGCPACSSMPDDYVTVVEAPAGAW